MYDPVNEAQHALDRYNEILQEAEHYRLVRSMQAPQMSVLSQLQSRLIRQIEPTRPQPNRRQRA